MKPELENKLIEISSYPIAFVMSGSVDYLIRMSVKEAVIKFYDGVKIVGRELRRLIYPNNSPLYCI